MSQEIAIDPELQILLERGPAIRIRAVAVADLLPLAFDTNTKAGQ